MKTARRQGWDGYASDWADRYGGYDLRRTQGAARGWHRAAYRCGRWLSRLRLPPAAAAAMGLVAAVAVPVAAGQGPRGVLLAAGLVLLSAFLAAVAAALAVISSGASRHDVIWEAVASRLGEVGWLVGFWVAGVPAVLVIGTGLTIGIHEYVRAHALAAGMSRIAVQTASDRSIRVPVVVAALVIAGLAGLISAPLAAGTLTVLTGAWLVLALIGLFQLVEVVRHELSRSSLQR